MRAVVFERFGGPEVLVDGVRPEPHPGPGEVRIRVKAAGVSPVDLALRAGTSPSAGGLALPHIPGVDAAGIVDEVGAAVTGVGMGDEVFGAVDVSRLGGATAEFAVLAFWARKPVAMSWKRPAAVEPVSRRPPVLSSSSAWAREWGCSSTVAREEWEQWRFSSLSLWVRASSRPGSAGGLRFIATVGAGSVAHGPGLARRVRASGFGPIDLALDVAGKGSLPELIELTGSPANVVSLADFTAPKLGVRLSTGVLGGQPSGTHGLARAASLGEQGKFRVAVERVYPMSRAAEAHAAAQQGPRRGKIVLAADWDR